jgi:hypothetical protein
MVYDAPTQIDRTVSNDGFQRSILAVCTDILTVLATCHNLGGLINYEARKPVRIRRGRATVIDLGLMGMRFESQTFLRSI